MLCTNSMYCLVSCSCSSSGYLLTRRKGSLCLCVGRAEPAARPKAVREATHTLRQGTKAQTLCYAQRLRLRPLLLLYNSVHALLCTSLRSHMLTHVHLLTQAHAVVQEHNNSIVVVYVYSRCTHTPPRPVGRHITCLLQAEAKYYLR